MENPPFDQNSEQPAPEVLNIFRQVIDVSIQSGESLDDFKARLEVELQARQRSSELQQQWLEQAQDRLWQLFQLCPQAIAELGFHELKPLPPSILQQSIDDLADLSRARGVEPAALHTEPEPPLDLIDAAARIVRLIRAELPESKAYSLQDALWLAFLALNGPTRAGYALQSYPPVKPRAGTATQGLQRSDLFPDPIRLEEQTRWMQLGMQVILQELQQQGSKPE